MVQFSVKLGDELEQEGRTVIMLGRGVTVTWGWALWPLCDRYLVG